MQASAQAVFDGLRYQLLSGTAGAIAYAAHTGSTRAVFLVQEFVTDDTADERHERNAADLDQLLERITFGKSHRLHPGELVGPIQVLGQPLFDSPVPLYIGKAVRWLRSRRSQQRSEGFDSSFRKSILASVEVRLQEFRVPGQRCRTR
jgi:hypothetical protein